MDKLYRSILKAYLKIHMKYHGKTVAFFQQRIDGGIHYTNIFNRRWEFFSENLTSNDVVLDIACGTGKILKEVSRKVKKGIGVEISEKNYSFALQNMNNYKNLEFIKGDIFEIDYSKFVIEKNITVGILSHILEHIQYPSDFLRKLTLKRLLICVPSEENSWADFLKSCGLSYKTDETHFREYTREVLLSHLLEGGYTSVFMGFNQEGEIICMAEKTVAQDSHLST